MPMQASYADARIWLEENLPDKNPRILEDYAKFVSTGLAEKANAIRQQIESSGFLVMPQPFQGDWLFRKTLIQAPQEMEVRRTERPREPGDAVPDRTLLVTDAQLFGIGFWPRCEGSHQKTSSWI